MMRNLPVWLVLLVVAAFALTVPTASAHEERDVADGQYQIVVGFLDEPAVVGEKNGLSLRVTKPAGPGATPAAEGTEHEAAGVPVEGLEATLTAEVIYGDQRMDLQLYSLAPIGDPGAYVSYFIPTAEGAYSFHISGDIEGVTIDETFSGEPVAFEVWPREPLEFPKDEANANGEAPGTPNA
jgi:hypothetical protein